MSLFALALIDRQPNCDVAISHRDNLAECQRETPALRHNLFAAVQRSVRCLVERHLIRPQSPGGVALGSPEALTALLRVAAFSAICIEALNCFGEKFLDLWGAVEHMQNAIS